MKRHAFHREAEEEYADEANYYARLDLELGGRFYDEIEQLIRDIRQQPDRFRLFDAPIRRHFSDVLLEETPPLKRAKAAMRVAAAFEWSAVCCSCSVDGFLSLTDVYLLVRANSTGHSGRTGGEVP